MQEAIRLKDLYDEALAAPTNEISFTSAAITHNVLISATRYAVSAYGVEASASDDLLPPTTGLICATTCSAYVPQRSHPDRGIYFFVYQITMTNKGLDMVQLKSRHWTITDANGKVSNVRYDVSPVAGTDNATINCLRLQQPSPADFGAGPLYARTGLGAI